MKKNICLSFAKENNDVYTITNEISPITWKTGTHQPIQDKYVTENNTNSTKETPKIIHNIVLNYEAFSIGVTLLNLKAC